MPGPQAGIKSPRARDVGQSLDAWRRLSPLGGSRGEPLGAGRLANYVTGWYS